MASVATHGLPGSRMSGKERLEAAVRCEEVDRVPWAPKVFIGHYRSGTSAAHQRMSVAEFADVLHCDAIAWENLITAKADGVTHETTKHGHTTTRLTQTPVGDRPVPGVTLRPMVPVAPSAMFGRATVREGAYVAARRPEPPTPSPRNGEVAVSYTVSDVRARGTRQ